MKYAFLGNFYLGASKIEEKLRMVEVKFFFTCKGTFVTLLRSELGGMATCVLLSQKEDTR